MTWHLYVSDGETDWVRAGAFERLSDAAARIAKLEKLPQCALSLEPLLEPNTSDDEALSLFRCTGFQALYAIRNEAP